MPKEIDGGARKGETAKATQAPAHREYPLEGGPARDAAIRRLSYRGIKAPTEYEIWREFRQFPDVLGEYHGPASAAEQASFYDYFYFHLERAELRLYGRILAPHERGPVAVAFEPKAPAEKLSSEELLAAWDRSLARAQAEGASEKRLGFLRRGRARLEARIRRRAAKGEQVTPEDLLGGLL